MRQGTCTEKCSYVSSLKLVIVGFVSVLIIIRLLCPISDALLEAKGDTEEDSAPKSTVEKPPSTPEMSARDAEDMANAMLRNSPLPDAESLRGVMKDSQRVVEATSFQKEARSFLKRKVVGSCSKKPIQVNL